MMKRIRLVANRISPMALDRMMPRFSADDFEKITPQLMIERKNFIRELVFMSPVSKVLNYA
jgi:hypothetical protein